MSPRERVDLDVGNKKIDQHNNLVKKLKKKKQDINNLQYQKAIKYCREPKQKQANSAHSSDRNHCAPTTSKYSKNKTKWPTSSALQQVMEIIVH